MKIIKKIRRTLSNYTWDLAYGDYDEDLLLRKGEMGKLHIIKNPYKTKWFADPFILNVHSQKVCLLVEEFDSNVKRGRIAKITIDRLTDTIVDCKIVLDTQTHLSFPVIYTINDKIYVHPENSASGNSYIYEYDKTTESLVHPALLVNEPLVDPVIVQDNGRYIMCATRVPDTCGRFLEMYESADFFGPYERIRSIDYKRKEARMAGNFIKTSWGLIRPAQDCNHNYGEAVLFYKNLSKISEIRPHMCKYEGVHTFNKVDNFYVVDLKKYAFPLIHRVLKRINRLMS
jgi:hypothetical protein